MKEEHKKSGMKRNNSMLGYKSLRRGQLVRNGLKINNENFAMYSRIKNV